MTLELDGKFIIAVWMVPLDQPRDMNGRTYRRGDWLATLYKVKDAANYGLHYRFRYYADDKVHDSEDYRSEAEGIFTGKTEAEVMTIVSEMAESLAKMNEKGNGRRSEIHKLIIRSSDPHTIIEHLSREKFFFMRPLTEDEKKALSKNASAK